MVTSYLLHRCFNRCRYGNLVDKELGVLSSTMVITYSLTSVNLDACALCYRSFSYALKFS